MMSSSSDPMTERLLCSICLEVFSDPVSTPCGHNFCKICLSTYWNNSQDCRCPNCNETFKQRPDLKINTTLRDVVDEHKKKCHEEQAEVVCDICSEGKLKAVKSCLVCQSSYCETHLEPHLRVSGLQKHKLMDPVKNLQDYICQKHDRPLELFCRDDHTRVCLSCADGDHKNHNTVCLEEVKHMKGWRRQKKSSPALNLQSLLFERSEARMWFIISVGISVLMFFYFSSPTDVETLNIEKLSDAVLKWMQQYAVDVTLDPDTAHPNLILSDDEKQVRIGDIYHKLPDNPKRFDTCVNVLGKEGFSSGRFYYEVQVKGKSEWSLGVATQSVNRKGQITLTPDDGFWTVVLRNDYDYRGAAGPDVFLCLRVKPQKVGVFVDYEEGLVSFYDVESRSHIFSFSGQYFTEKLYPFFSPEPNNKGKNSEPLIITPVSK
ncbi:zinc-binding protein A33-like isoform X1 [Triplophysa rosa]|uniref:zinc-binding protein A33-like isoform X1 n=1 Tax=Triplophysa rosa TaxID=992332 RepID=UPI0025462175|nr:zinc-binding protein A33-like isoform X1 [Triplophysa rosa]XP_057184387.1 zinc-binding protein A33-like isoform X2 [Triplophysa rosa]XP_057184388.1 zinc-binding protein A33-like isoform X1 [Triplophysa rosa]